MRQKLGLAIALAKGARVLFLDEPMSGLDPASANDLVVLLQQLARDGVAILMVTHDILRAHQVADRIGIVRRGKVVEEVPSSAMTPQQIEELYVHHLRESTTLLALLGVWITLALLIPAAIGAIAKTADPPPSRFELIAAARAAEVQAASRAAELVGGYVHDHPELERTRPAKDPNAPKPPWDYVTWGQRYFVIVREIERAVAPISARFDATLAEQRATARRLRLLSPPLLLHSTLAQLAGTDEARTLAFRAQAQAFQQRLRDDLGHRAMAQRDLSPQELAGLGGFELVEPAISVEAPIPILVLWLVAIALAATARRRLQG